MAVVKMPILFGAILVLQVVTAHNGSSDVMNVNEHAIVGGENASISDFPYQLSLRRNGSHDCGAVVISSQWALSAAHCISKDAASTEYSLRAGSSRSDIGGDLYVVVRIVVHAQNNRETMDYDISAIQTARPFEFSPVIKPIALDPVTTDFPPQAFSVVTGWGKLVYGPKTPISKHLQSVLLPMVDHSACVSIYSELSPVVPNVTDTMICAGAEPKGRGPCHGDSGGPLAYRGRLVGVVSWGVGCGNRRYPGVYTSISALRGWIHDTTGI